MNKCLFLFLLLTSTAWAQRQTIVLDDGVKVICRMKDGIVHGPYRSFHPDGTLCARGRFQHNFRVGKWSAWDAEGKLRVQRKYTAPFVYTTTFSHAPSTPLTQLLNVPQYQPSRHEAGYMKYHFIHERMVFWEGRFWRYLPNDPHNAPWMNPMFQLIHTTVQDGDLQVYHDDQFEDSMAVAAIPKPQGDLIGFKLKEVFFFDTDRFLSETRILSLCPLFLDPETQDTTELYWVYYPEIRELLATLSFKSKNNRLRNCDDVFFFRAFSSFIYQIYNVERIPLITAPLSKQNLQKVSNKAEIELLEFEHGTWLFFSRQAP